MNHKSITRIEKLDLMTRRWWFLLIFILLGTVMPPIVTKGPIDPSEISQIITYILANALVNQWAPFYPLFKVIPIVLVVGLILLGNRVSRLFSLYVGISYVLFAFLQNIAITDKYGFSMVTGNVITMLLVAGFWFGEVFFGKNDFSSRKIPAIRYWLVPLAFLAFWSPINPTSFRPDFNPAYLVTNSSGLAFCMMTPVYLAILALYYPTVNIPTLRVTSLLGMVIGFWNLVTDFLLQPDLLWWMGVLHIPLVIISIYTFILSFKKASPGKP